MIFFIKMPAFVPVCTFLFVSSNIFFIKEISGLFKLVRDKLVIGDWPMLPKIELTADSSVSVAIGVVISKKKGAEAPV